MCTALPGTTCSIPEMRRGDVLDLKSIEECDRVVRTATIVLVLLLDVQEAFLVQCTYCKLRTPYVLAVMNYSTVLVDCLLYSRDFR